MLSNTIAHPKTQAAASNSLAVQINDAHAEAARSLRASVEHATRAGELLIEAKRQHGRHGTWSQWLQDNVDFSERLAQAYMRLARMPVEKRNAVADLPLREALSAIRSRQNQIADAEARDARQADFYSGVVYTTKDGQSYYGADAITAIPSSPAPPAQPPKPEEIADHLIRQLSQAHYEVRESISSADLSAAFARHFGEPIPVNDPPAISSERLIEAWDKAGPKQWREFVLARKVQIMRAQQEVGWTAYGDISPLAPAVAADAALRAPKNEAAS
jgi:hypothetical protein